MTSRPGARKARPPELPTHLVPRPRLTAQLNAAVQQPLTLVAAGPGWGKTVTLRSWMESRTAPTAWLSVEPSDNQPKRFWKLVGEALVLAGMISDTEATTVLSHDRRDPTRFLTELLDALPGPADRVLVIDDAHLLTDAILLAEIDALVRYGGAHLKLVLGARSDPILPLHRYRLSGTVAEIRARDLAMTKTEARNLLRTHGVTLSATALDLLASRTEGWAAGLTLCAMSMAGARHPGRFVTQLAIDHGSVGEYLIEEVLNRQPERVRRVLIQTSFLDEVSGPLAAAVTGVLDSSRVLSELSRTNSFVVPVDGDSGRFRYHQLFAEILRYLLRREFPGRERELRSRAATWFEEEGDTVTALKLAIDADDPVHAASVLVHGGLARAMVERTTLADLELDRITALDPSHDMGEEDATEVALGQAAIAAIQGQFDAAEQGLDSVDRDRLAPDLQVTAGLIDVLAASQRGALADLDRAAAKLIEPGISANGNGHGRGIPGLPSALRAAQASARFFDIKPHAQVEAMLLDALAGAQQARAGAVQLQCLGLLELSYALEGRIEHAKECDQRTHALMRRWPQVQPVTAHHLAQAYLAYLRFDLPRALKFIRSAEQNAIAEGDALVEGAVVVVHAQVLIAFGRVADAHQLLRSAPSMSRDLPRRLARVRSVTLATLETRLGRPNAALKMIAETDAGTSKDPWLALETARALLAQGELPSAEDALRPALIAWDITPPLPLLVEALLVSAQIADAGGFEVRAVAEVLRATELAGDAIVQPFADSADSLAPLLARHPEARAAYPRFELVDPDEAAPRTAALQLLADALTEREVAVLRRLATTMTTAEIAAELCVSINTVKTHIAAIYRKLPAAGRRDAVSRARQLELL